MVPSQISSPGFILYGSKSKVQSCFYIIGQQFSLGTPISFTNKTEHHNITEILLKVALQP